MTRHGPIASRTRGDVGSSPGSSTVPETIVAVGNVGCGGPIVPLATSGARSMPRGPSTLNQSGTSTGRSAVMPGQCSIRAGLPSSTTVSPASSPRSVPT